MDDLNDPINDPDEYLVREVFAYFGRAMYAASCVESGLVLGLMQAELMSQTVGRARREKSGPTRAEWEARFDAYMARHEQLGMGTLIGRFRSVLKVDTELDALLDEALARRNRLAHAFFREKAVDFAHSAGCAGMITELEQDHALFRRAEDVIAAAVANISPRLGIDPETHQSQVDAISQALLDEARGQAKGP